MTSFFQKKSPNGIFWKHRSGDNTKVVTKTCPSVCPNVAVKGEHGNFDRILVLQLFQIVLIMLPVEETLYIQRRTFRNIYNQHTPEEVAIWVISTKVKSVQLLWIKIYVWFLLLQKCTIHCLNLQIYNILEYVKMTRFVKLKPTYISWT